MIDPGGTRSFERRENIVRKLDVCGRRRLRLMRSIVEYGSECFLGWMGMLAKVTESEKG